MAHDEKPENDHIIRGLLDSVERNAGLSQRRLAADLGIALGLTNAYLKRCVRKGYLKITQVPLNRYNYYLTPRGFAEKSRLTTEYLLSSLDLFRRARHDCTAMLSECRSRGWNTLVLWGTGDLSEITMLSAAEAGIKIVGIVDPAMTTACCAGQDVSADLAAAIALAGAPTVDAILVTDIRAPLGSYNAAKKAAAEHGLAADRVLTLGLLGIHPGNPDQDSSTAA